MNATGHFEEDDLALYAMHLLTEQEASAVARRLAESEGVRVELAKVQARLAAYAESAVELRAVPEGSLDRLMSRIGQEKKVIPMPVAVPAKLSEQRPRRSAGLMPWMGWAVAAGMTVAAGKLYEDRVALHRMLTAQTGQVVHMSADAVDVSRDRNELTASLAERTKELETLRTEAAKARGEAADLRAAAGGQEAKLDDQTAKLSEQTTRAGNEAGRAASAAKERDELRGTVAAQANQVAQLSTDAAKARLVLDTLNDPTALRVTLTKPKTAAVPTGRATYLASRGALVFLANNLAPLKANKVYELWILPADGSKPVPAGTFVPDARGNASVVSGQFARSVEAKVFAVTVENVGGSQTPTLPILLAGT